MEAEPARFQGDASQAGDPATGTANAAMSTFIGGPWHGQTRPRIPDARVAGSPGTAYLPWHAHPATAGILAEPQGGASLYVAEDMHTRDLLKWVEDSLLHAPADTAVLHTCTGANDMRGERAT